MGITNKWLLATLALLPSYLIRFTILNIPFNLLDALVVVGFLVMLFEFKGLRVSKSFATTAISFLVIGAVSVLVSAAKLDALGLYKSYVVLPVMIGAMIQASRPKLRDITISLGLGVVYISIVALVQWLTGYGVPAPWNVGGIDVRMTSIYDYPNAVGLFCAPVVAMAFAWLVHEPNERLFQLIVLVMGVAAIGLSRSDGAIVAVVVAMSMVLLFTRYRYWVLIIGILGLGLLLVYPTTRQILLLQDASGEVRLALWQGTVDLLRAHPITGAGLANFPNEYAKYKLDRHVELLLYPHNIILDFWVEFGVLGVVWLAAVVSRFFWKAVRAVRIHQSVVLLAGMVAVLVYGLVDVPYFKNDLAILFWVLLAANDLLSD